MDGDHVAGRMVVHDEPTIAAMKAGKRQVSCGYECDLVEEPGVAPDGQRFDAYQTNIVYNHVAIVDVGRAGTARVRMDGASVRVDDDLSAGARDNMPTREFAAPPDKLPIENVGHVRDAMSRFGETHFTSADEKRSAFHKIVAKAKQLNIDADNFIKEWSGRLDHAEPGKDRIMNLEQALAALAAANEKLGAANLRADSAEKARDTEKQRADKAEADRDIFKSRFDEAEKQRKDAVDGSPGKVRARVALETAAIRVLGGKIKRADGVEIEVAAAADRELKLAVIKHVENVDCDVDPAGQKRSDVYVDARYDAAIERAGKSAETFQHANAVIDAARAQTPPAIQRTDGGAAPGAADAARQKMVEDNQKMHANHLAASAK
jgi:hypothetical protein